MDELNEKQREVFFKLSFFEQQMKNLQQQINAVEEAIFDMAKIENSLEEIKGKKGQEVFASVGRGIYFKAKLESEELLVDVGEKKFVKKSVEETKELIRQQKDKLENVREEINENLQQLEENIREIVNESEG